MTTARCKYVTGHVCETVWPCMIVKLFLCPNSLTVVIQQTLHPAPVIPVAARQD